MNQQHLENSYAAKSLTENAVVYDEWATVFEEEMGAMGYVNPALTPALVQRWANSQKDKILDAGCATGQIGQYLNLIGYNNLYAIDHSPMMVAFAIEKQVYNDVQQMTLGGPLLFENEEFDIVIPMGIFTPGHAPIESLDELLRILKMGGLMIFSCTEPAYDSGFGDKFKELEESNIWILIDKTKPYITIPGASFEHQKISYIYVYRKL